jgi:hypothetical protein
MFALELQSRCPFELAEGAIRDTLGEDIFTKGAG